MTKRKIMANTYSPDRWVIVGTGETFKVFGNWSGGYLDGDSWRLSSGLEKIEQDPEDEDYLLMHNCSGSIYRCRKQAEGMTGYGASIFGSWTQYDYDGKLKLSTIDEFNAAGDANETEESGPKDV
jgi:hypothetical protein